MGSVDGHAKWFGRARGYPYQDLYRPAGIRWPRRGI